MVDFEMVYGGFLDVFFVVYGCFMEVGILFLC